jgi:hypothetical protein
LIRRLPRTLLGLAAAAAALAPAGAPLALGQEAAPPAAPAAPAAPEAKNATDAEAAAALERFTREFDTPDLSLRRDAFQAVRKVLHPKVADRLFEIAAKHAETPVRTEAMKALALQTPQAKTHGPKVARWLTEEAEKNRKAKARGDYGLPIDVKTGDVDSTSEEGKAAYRRKVERGALLAAGIRVLDRFEYRDKDGVETLSEFLQDGNDDLVAGVLGMLGKWKVWTVLPQFLDLFEMYPEEDSFETGSVSVDTGAAGSADAQAAKRKWNAKYGDPDKRRPRPKLVRALKAAITEITGEKFTKPEELREFLKRPEVKRKVKGK